MIRIISKFEDTAIVPADAGGPFKVAQGSPVTFKPVNTHPDASHDWDLGDGTFATGSVVTHTYPVPGFYVVKLTTVVNQEGGTRTRHFAALTVENLAPKVDAGPDITVKEGDPILLTGSFTDPGWLDTHTATWFWGDDDPSQAGMVVEAHDPPTGAGTVVATHAWGDAGKYSAILSVQDNHGGVGEAQTHITVLNVPPTVDAGPPMFAYPGKAITLEATFKDPGWLDSHEGKWDFGDGCPPMTATVIEKHEPPTGVSSVSASHIYQHRGCYCCVCAVTDDDGASGFASKTVHVVDVLNAGFEDGFRGTLAGSVANEWESYAASIAEFDVRSRPLLLPARTFKAEEFLVYGGQRSQRIRVDSEMRVGIYQRIGANPGWSYQITSWYCLLETAGGMARLGVDPTGSVDPTAPSILWMTGRAQSKWEELTARIVAQKDGLTILLEAIGRYQPTREEKEEISDTSGGNRSRERNPGADACFDCVCLLPVQPVCSPKPTTPRDRAVPHFRPPERSATGHDEDAAEDR
jgi:PKD repeat protein